MSIRSWWNDQDKTSRLIVKGFGIALLIAVFISIVKCSG